MVELRNLVPGNTYLIIAIPAEQHSDRLRLELYNKYEEAASVLISNPARPQSRRWQATASTVMLVVEKPIGSTLSNAAYLSVACESCPAESNWIDKFMGQADAVVSTTGGISASSLVTNTLIGGNCFDVANITSSGAANSRGTFNNGSTSIGINTGVVLCTGNVNVIPGPNTSSSSSGNTAGFNVNTADDPDLATLTAGNQWDVSRIEFDFTPTAENVQFDFVFGSEEYCEYVGTNFNDVFGFFISGPGISGNQNIALLPGSTTPVSINNVNHTTNTTYYINNNTFNACGGLGAAAVGDIALDGYTTILTATAELIPCETYHIKLAIADVADGSWASAVFLKANSFEAGGNAKALPVYPAGAQFVYEGNCGGGGFIRFVRGSGDINVPLVIDYTVSPNSTATVGLDYAPLPNPITIPAGQSEILIPVTVFSDLIIEGNESIILVLDQACTCTQQEVEFIIAEVPPLEIEMDDITICGTGNATLSPNIVSPGVPNYTYNWSTGATTPSISVNTPGTTTYTVTVTDNCNTTATAQATVNLTPAPTATLTGSGTLCVGTTGSFNLTITFTGIAPWEVEWNGNTETFTSSPATVTVTDPGTYTLTSVSSNDCPGTVSGSAVITEVEVDLNLNGTDPTCNGISNGSITSSVSGGTAPYNYTWSPTGTGANPTNLPAGTYNVTVTSSQGCTDEAEITLEEPDPLTVSVT
ncbi:MAG: choice-of-anchor L domain-containing protein, partial [Bacteroidota bacterium]